MPKSGACRCGDPLALLDRRRRRLPPAAVAVERHPAAVRGRGRRGDGDVRAAGRRLAARLHRRADRCTCSGRGRRGRAPPDGPLPRQQLLSRQPDRLTMVKQLTFELALPPPTFAREDFVVGDGNREALAWLDRWPDWPAPALALSGPAGSGKTHLGRIWAARAGAVVLDAPDLEGKSVPDLTALAEAHPAILVDHADRAPDRALFHLYNLMRERRAHLLLVAELPPAHWRIALPDLASRLRAAPTIAVAPPDDELLGSIILKQLGDRQLHAGPGVVQYLVARMERSAETARRVVAALDQRALSERREIDRRLAADVLTELSGRTS